MRKIVVFIFLGFLMGFYGRSGILLFRVLEVWGSGILGFRVWGFSFFFFGGGGGGVGWGRGAGSGIGLGSLVYGLRVRQSSTVDLCFGSNASFRQGSVTRRCGGISMPIVTEPPFQGDSSFPRDSKTPLFRYIP